MKLRESQVSKQDHNDVLKSELTRRDETIQKLRRDVLVLQEKRDTHQAEVWTLTRVLGLWLEYIMDKGCSE